VLFPICLAILVDIADFSLLFSDSPSYVPSPTVFVAIEVLSGIAVFLFIHMWKAEERLSEALATTEQELRAATDAKIALSNLVGGTYRMVEYLDSVIGVQTDKLRGALKSLVSGNGVPHCRTCLTFLDPERYIKECLVVLHKFFSHWLTPGHSLRIAYFEPQDGGLKVTYSFDGTNTDVIHSPNRDYQDRFTLELLADEKGMHRSLASHLSACGGEILVGNAAEADKDTEHPFRYFGDRQKVRVRSLFGFSVEVRDVEPAGQRHRAVVLCDSNQTGLFDEKDATKVRIAGQLATRISVRIDHQVRLRALVGAIKGRLSQKQCEV